MADNNARQTQWIYDPERRKAAARKQPPEEDTTQAANDESRLYRSARKTVIANLRDGSDDETDGNVETVANRSARSAARKYTPVNRTQDVVSGTENPRVGFTSMGPQHAARKHPHDSYSQPSTSGEIFGADSSESRPQAAARKHSSDYTSQPSASDRREGMANTPSSSSRSQQPTRNFGRKTGGSSAADVARARNVDSQIPSRNFTVTSGFAGIPRFTPVHDGDGEVSDSTTIRRSTPNAGLSTASSSTVRGPPSSLHISSSPSSIKKKVTFAVQGSVDAGATGNRVRQGPLQGPFVQRAAKKSTNAPTGVATARRPAVKTVDPGPWGQRQERAKAKNKGGRNHIDHNHRPTAFKSFPVVPIKLIKEAAWKNSIRGRHGPRRSVASMSASSRRMSVEGRREGLTNSGRASQGYYLGKRARIKTVDQEDDPDDSDLDMEVAETHTVPARKTDLQFGVKSAKKRRQSPAFNMNPTPETSEESEHSVELFSDTSEAGDDVPESDYPGDQSDDGNDNQMFEAPTEDLMTALEALTLSSVCLQSAGRLPFLRRNLRVGFVGRCAMSGLNTKAVIHPSKSVLVTYRLRAGENQNEEDGFDDFKVRMEHWTCPLCELHGAFQTRNMLDKHLEWDHPTVQVSWEHGEDELVLSIDSSIVEEQPLMISSHLIQFTVKREEPVKQGSMLTDASSRTAVSFTPTSSRAVSTTSASAVSATSTMPTTDSSSRGDSEDVKPEVKDAPLSPTRPTKRRTSRLSLRSRSGSSMTFYSRPGSRTPSSQPSNYPTPPPEFDPFGPAIDISAWTERNGSNRPGSSPKLYDVLKELSLEPYGALSWSIVDREEEIFEVDDVRDEDKVMLALWSRWIFFNRTKFIANYFNGMKAFVNEHWHMIHRAAGWGAFRVWLLAFVVNRFLTGMEAVSIIQHYERLTGMHQWYTEGGLQGNEVMND